jgi:hypothetical protein
MSEEEDKFWKNASDNKKGKKEKEGLWMDDVDSQRKHEK